MALNYASSKLTYASKRFRQLAEHDPLPVIQKGKAIPVNLRKEALTADDLIGGLRLNGIDDIREVKVAFVESDGKLSIVRKQPASGGAAADNRIA